MLFQIVLLCAVCIFPVYAAKHHPQDFLDSIQGQQDEGKKIVQHFCATCHAIKPVINLGAPKIAEKSDWLIRYKQGLDILFKHTAEGYNAMPPRGGCFECSDDQLKKAIQAMLPIMKENTK